MLVICISVAKPIAAQTIDNELESWNRERIQIGKSGMAILSGWAIGNLAVGGIGNFSTSSHKKYFHQMNAAWNVVNLSISATAYYRYHQMDSHALSLTKSLREARKMENILLFNMGLDLGYIATGGLLWERGIRTDNDRLLGYGPSLIIQGGFLMIFDAILYATHVSRNERLFKLTEMVSFTGTEMSVRIPL